MNWIFFAIAGSIAQLIDGSLGMGFGLTSSTLLLTLGASAAVASAAVHAAEIGTTLASGASHWQAKNIDKQVLIRLAVPGGIGAFLGATFLSSIDLSSSKIFISTLLLALGFLLLFRNLFHVSKSNVVDFDDKKYFLTFLGFSGGFVDAAGGGGWGPVVTPTLLTATKMTPRKIIGTVSAAEFVVAVSASVGFLLNLNKLNMDWRIVGALALGGIIVAPIAAKIVANVPRKQLGVLVALAVILINGFRILAS